MHLRPVQALAIGLVLSLAGCGTFRSFPLPITKRQGIEMVPQLRAAATELGHDPHFNDGAVWFEADPEVRVIFQGSQASNTFIILVNIASSVPPDQLEERTAAAKAKADAVWTKALEIRRSLGQGTP